MRFLFFSFCLSACTVDTGILDIGSSPDPDVDAPIDTGVVETDPVDTGVPPDTDEPLDTEEPVDTDPVDTGEPIDTGDTGVAVPTCATAMGSSCELRTYDGRDYLFCLDDAEWDGARNSCEAMGDGCHLATAGDAGEDVFLMTTLATFGPTLDYWWFGLTDAPAEGAWEWIDGTPLTYGNWHPGEPNDENGEDCGHLFQGYGAWNDISCTNSYPYVCEAG